MSQKECVYQCGVCKEVRRYYVDTGRHTQDAENSANGLVLYSDIHRCDAGILGINNLRIDANYSIRSFEPLKLPTKAQPTSFPGLPSPRAKSAESTLIFKVRNQSDNEMRLLIHDRRLNSVLNIGLIDTENEVEIATITSDLGTISMSYYPSEVTYTSFLEKWLQILVNTLEVLLPTKIGLFIETLRYISTLSREAPSPFHIKLLKTILTTHETYFLINEDVDFESRLSDVAHKYNDDLVIAVKALMDELRKNPMMPLQHFTDIETIRKQKEDVVYLIHTFLIMEQEEFITIERPGIVEEEF